MTGFCSTEQKLGTARDQECKPSSYCNMYLVVEKKNDKATPNTFLFIQDTKVSRNSCCSEMPFFLLSSMASKHVCKTSCASPKHQSLSKHVVIILHPRVSFSFQLDLKASCSNRSFPVQETNVPQRTYHIQPCQITFGVLCTKALQQKPVEKHVRS